MVRKISVEGRLADSVRWAHYSWSQVKITLKNCFETQAKEQSKIWGLKWVIKFQVRLRGPGGHMAQSFQRLNSTEWEDTLVAGIPAGCQRYMVFDTREENWHLLFPLSGPIPPTFFFVALRTQLSPNINTLLHFQEANQMLPPWVPPDSRALFSSLFYSSTPARAFHKL